MEAFTRLFVETDSYYYLKADGIDYMYPYLKNLGLKTMQSLVIARREDNEYTFISGGKYSFIHNFLDAKQLDYVVCKWMNSH